MANSRVKDSPCKWIIARARISILYITNATPWNFMLGDDTFITYITSSMRIVFILFFFVQPLHIGQVSRAIIVARKTFSHTHMMWPIFFHICQSKSFWWLRKDLDDFYSICTRSNCTIWCKRGICVLNCFNCSHVEWFQLQFMVWHFPLDQSSSAKLAEWNSWWATCEELRSTGGLRVCAIESNVNNPKTKKNKNKKINQKKWKRNERNANK